MTVPLKLSPLPDGKSWVLTESYLRFYENMLIVVPIGFTTDFASVPRCFWSLFPPWRKYGPASIVHDYHYRTTPKLVSRKKADQIMYTLMKEDKVHVLSRMIIYAGVRIGGWYVWNRYHRDEK